DDLITGIKITQGNMKIGDVVTGQCVPQKSVVQNATTIALKPVTITEIRHPNPSEIDIEISDKAECDKSNETFTATPPPPPPPPTHYLRVNDSLFNDWAVFGDERPQEGATLGQGFAKPLGNGTYNIYLEPGRSGEYSDFVLFVLEATLQSTSAAGGAPGKGTPQKAGAAPPLQTPAAAEVTLQ
ncbi:MAG TPA: hypothetical protein VLZ74_11020, partial [Methylocella sp.]|nr:hypothetical protein [Methylocella sp.]